MERSRRFSKVKTCFLVQDLIKVRITYQDYYSTLIILVQEEMILNKYFAGVFMVFLNPVNGTPPCLPFLLGNIGGSPGNNLPLTSDIIRIPLKSTNKYWRTLTSAKDDRWTAKAIGISWVILALSPLIFAMTVDVLNYAIQKSTPPSSGSGGGNTTGSSGVAENTSSQNNPPETSENRDKSVAIVHDMDNA